MRATSEPPVCAAAPLDFSFKELRQCAEIETEEPRASTGKRGQRDETRAAEAASSATAEPAPLGAAGVAGGGAPPGPGKAVTSMVPRRRFFVRSVTTSVKLNNNMLESLQGLPRALEASVNNPLENIQWLDLSFNQLSTIEPELLEFQSLKALYLHGNSIKSLPSIERLRKLPRLLSLTLNGNPIEANKVYRMFTIGALQQLKSLDHTTITEDEIKNAISWYKGHLIRLKKKQEEAADAALRNDD